MRLDVPDHVPAAEDLGRVHFVGLGGAGLSAIARIMLERGVAVSGSDATGSPLLDALRADGAQAHVGHAAQHVDGVDTLVVSTAVRDDNPEVVAARAAGLRVLPRSAGLQSVMAGRDVLAVAGTHGKTTTTAMLTIAMRAAGHDVSYAVGAEVPGLGTNARAGAGPWFVAEADESDGAFLVYEPLGAVVTNVDADHLDVWGTEEAYRAAFGRFLDRIRPGGFVVGVVDDPGARDLLDLARRRGLDVVGVGEAPDADLRMRHLRVSSSGTSYDVVVSDRSTGGGDEVLGSVTLQVPGRHYALDSLAALAAGLRTGTGFDALVRGLAAYTGSRRRMEHVGTAGGVRVYDSYAHHATEITGDLDSARALAGDGRLVVCFQPHLVSRTRTFGAQMGAALSAADEVVVPDLYLAREDPDPQVTSDLVSAAVDLPAERVHRVGPVADAPALLARIATPGDLVLTLGAGDVTTAAPALVALLQERPTQDRPTQDQP